MEALKLKYKNHFNQAILRPLVSEGKLALTEPDKPNSPKQKYLTVIMQCSISR